jgi:hypothetical protein
MCRGGQLVACASWGLHLEHMCNFWLYGWAAIGHLVDWSIGQAAAVLTHCLQRLYALPPILHGTSQSQLLTATAITTPADHITWRITMRSLDLCWAFSTIVEYQHVKLAPRQPASVHRTLSQQPPAVMLSLCFRGTQYCSNTAVKGLLVELTCPSCYNVQQHADAQAGNTPVDLLLRSVSATTCYIASTVRLILLQGIILVWPLRPCWLHEVAGRG